MGGHALAHHALQPGQTYAILVLQELSHAADTAVAQVVDVVAAAYAVLEVYIVVDGRQYVLPGHMLGNEVMDAGAQLVRQYLRVHPLILRKYLRELGIIDVLRDAQCRRIAVHI